MCLAQGHGVCTLLWSAAHSTATNSVSPAVKSAAVQLSVRTVLWEKKLQTARKTILKIIFKVE